MSMKRGRPPGEKAADDRGVLVRPKRTEGGPVRKTIDRLEAQLDTVRRTVEGQPSSSSARVASSLTQMILCW